MMIFRLTVLTCFFLFSMKTTAALILDLNSSGVILSAKGLAVGQKTFDVRFVNGTCLTLFAGCDSAFFSFDNKQDADEASHSLLDQLLIDGVFGSFDTNFQLVNGCQTARNRCELNTFYRPLLSSGTISASQAENFAQEATHLIQGDRVGSDVFNNFTNTGGLREHTIALWTDVTASNNSQVVSSPSIIFLFVTATIFLASTQRQRRFNKNGL